MIRPTLRRLSVLALILALSLVLAAPAGARSLLHHEATPTEEPAEEPSWLDTALSFLSGLVPKALTLPPLPKQPLFGPSTGGCIDPLGNPADCPTDLL